MTDKTRKRLGEEVRTWWDKWALATGYRSWLFSPEKTREFAMHFAAPYVERAEQLERAVNEQHRKFGEVLSDIQRLKSKLEAAEKALLGTATAGVGSESGESAPVAKEILELYKLFPSNSHMSVGYRAEEGYHIEFSCLDVADVKKLAEQFIHKQVREIKWPEPRVIDATATSIITVNSDSDNE